MLAPLCTSTTGIISSNLMHARFFPETIWITLVGPLVQLEEEEPFNMITEVGFILWISAKNESNMKKRDFRKSSINSFAYRAKTYSMLRLLQNTAKRDKMRNPLRLELSNYTDTDSEG